MGSHLVAVASLGGPDFVATLQRVWDDGDALAVIDPRLGAAARDRALRALDPHVVIDPTGTRHRRPGAAGLDADAAVVVATSGTTGDAKAVVLSWSAVRASAEASSAALGVDPARDVWLANLPVAHVGGLSVVMRAVLTGTGLLAQEGFSTRGVAEAAAHGATLVSLVPTTLARVDPRPFRRILLGGQAPPGDLPRNVVVTYGLTETGSGVVYDGRPLRGVEIRLGEQGEVLIKGPQVARRYRDGTEVVDQEGWLHTGDVGHLDADGRLSIRGRLSEVIRSGGEKVWPSEVEDVLRRHPAIAEVAVAGRPDPRWGERVVAFVVPADGEPPPLEELKELVSAEIAPWAAPKELHTVRTLPRTAIGKVRRQELVAALESETGPA